MGITFKETKIGRIPEVWEVTMIGRVTDTHGGSTPSTAQQNYWDNDDVLWATPTDITSLGSKYISDTSRKISRRAVDETSLRLCEPGTILMTSRATIGYPAIADRPITTNQGFINIHCSEKIEIMFLYYWIVQNRRLLERFAQGSTFVELSKKDFRRFLIALPPLPEQRKIAEILSTVDQTIEKTDAIIKETQQFKKGLMQKLFVNKAFMVLRKAKEEETDLKLVAIHELGEIVTGTTPSTTVREYYDNPGYMFIGPADVGQSKRVVKSASYISEEGFAVSRQLPCNTVMVVGIGATIGKVGITSEPCTTNQQINNIIPNMKEFPADYVYYLLAGISDYVLGFAGQTATPIMNKGEFGKMLTFVHLTLEERQKIADILSEVDAEIEMEQSFKSELEQLKKGLMQVLLTGKVKVEV